VLVQGQVLTAVQVPVVHLICEGDWVRGLEGYEG
jgi:hypothetical protein